MGLGLRAPPNDKRGSAGETGGTARNALAADIVRMILVAAAYYVAAKLSLRLALVQRNVTPLWPPTGIAVVAFLVFGRRVWPGVAVAAFAVNAPISTNLLAAGVTAVGNTLAPFAAAALLQRVGFRREIDRLRDAVAIILAALTGMTISASIGAGTLVLSGAVAARGFGPAWAVWWAGDTMGVLVVAPFLLSVPGYRSLRSWGRRAELAALLAAIAAVTLAVMRSDLRIMFLTLPLLGFAAWRFQQLGAAPGALLVAGIAAWTAAHGLGPFESGTLFQKMLTLQAYNATVAFTSFLFAAVVTERLRAREALQRGAEELEARVQRRTSDLSAANLRLKDEITERKDAERKLRERERQLGEAQHMAHIGSWEWLIPEDRVTWSDEMFRIHGYRPQEFAVDFSRAVRQVHEEDVLRVRRNVQQALAEARDHRLPDIEYRITRADGTERVLLGKALLTVRAGGAPHRMVGTVQDVTEDKQAQREHLIAETLQRNLLPEGLPAIPGIELVARYVPAAEGMEVGGDWYDALEVPGGYVALAVGDVVGHGLRAASSMGQLRMALRAYAMLDPSPAHVVRRLHELIEHLALTEMATVIYILLDLDSGTVRYVSAGHPPPLVIPVDGEVAYLGGGLGPPLGTVRHPDDYLEAHAELPIGSTLVVYTDGLVERRGISITEGLDRLRRAASAGGDATLEAMCDRLLASVAAEGASDDIALLALRHVAVGGGPMHLSIRADPRSLAPARRAVRRWLEQIGAGPKVSSEILVACGEACANAVQHAYGAGEGRVDVDLALADGEVQVTVRDSGRWKAASGTGWGRGLTLMRGLMDSVEIDRGTDGTTVRMRRSLGAGNVP